MRICFILVIGGSIAMTALQGAGVQTPAHGVKLVVRPDLRTGRLVRSVATSRRMIISKVARPNSSSNNPSLSATALKEAVNRVAAKHDLPPQLVHSVIRAESDYNPLAISPKGALGLMQMVPSTAHRYGVTNVFDPLENLEGGVRYLKYLIEKYHGNYPLALAAYNAGEGAVARYGGIPPYPETVNYVLQVEKNVQDGQRGTAQQPGMQSLKAKPKELKSAEVHTSIEQIVGSDGKLYYISR